MNQKLWKSSASVWTLCKALRKLLETRLDGFGVTSQSVTSEPMSWGWGVPQRRARNIPTPINAPPSRGNCESSSSEKEMKGLRGRRSSSWKRQVEGRRAFDHLRDVYTHTEVGRILMTFNSVIVFLLCSSLHFGKVKCIWKSKITLDFYIPSSSKLTEWLQWSHLFNPEESWATVAVLILYHIITVGTTSADSYFFTVIIILEQNM